MLIRLTIALLITVLIIGCSEQLGEESTPIPRPTSVPTVEVSITTLTPSPTQTPVRKFIFYFCIKETKEPLSGDVYLNNKYLGYANNGFLEVPIAELSTGEVSIKTILHNKEMEFICNLTEKDLNYSGLNCFIPREETEESSWTLIYLTPTPTFTPLPTLSPIPSTPIPTSTPFEERRQFSDLDIALIEKKIFELVNAEREKIGVDPLRWNSRIWEIAYTYSKDMAERGYFSHTNPEGKDIFDRLQEDNIFYLSAGENLYAYPLIEGESEEKIAEEVLNGWLKSPVHKSLIHDLDNYFTDGAVGVFYNPKDKYFYVTLDLVKLKEKDEITLNRNYGVFYYLYNPALGLEMSKVKVKVKVTSNMPIDIYILPSKREFDKFMKNEGFKQLGYVLDIKTYEKTVEAEKGWGLMIYSPNFKANVNVMLDYAV